MHQLDHEHLLLVGLALHEPHARVARGVGQVPEACAGTVLLVLLERLARVALRVLAFEALAHLLLQLGVLLETALDVKLPILPLGLLGAHLLGACVLLVNVAILGVFVIVVAGALLVLDLNVIVDELRAGALLRLGRLARSLHLSLACLAVIVVVASED